MLIVIHARMVGHWVREEKLVEGDVLCDLLSLFGQHFHFISKDGN